MFNFLKSTSSPRDSSSSLQNVESCNTLLGLFESFVSNQSTCENIALCTEMGVQLSYKQLNDKAAELSSHINSHILQDGRPHLVGKLRASFIYVSTSSGNFLCLFFFFRYHDGKRCGVYSIHSCFIEI